MHKFIIVLAAFAAIAFPLGAFAQDVEIGPGGIGISPFGHHEHHHEGHHEGDGWREHEHEHEHARREYGGGRCRELRAACMHKEELGEEGHGNCRRYRAMCGG